MMNKQIINNKDEYLTFSVRIKDSTNELVMDYADKHKWSRNFAINEILTQFLACNQ